MLLSILIPTLENRLPLFERIQAQLQSQIATCCAHKDVQVLFERDRGTMSTGGKRNLLIERACGDFVAFVDDDDRISNDYLSSILGILRSKPSIDCIGIRGEITFKGKFPREFVHSLMYKDYSSKGGVYYRPPYHLNPTRRSIAVRYRFADVSYSEDIDWAMRLQRDGALQHEEFLDRVIYYYASRRDYRYQWLLDHSEGIRHALGLRAANRLKLRYRPAIARG